MLFIWQILIKTWKTFYLTLLIYVKKQWSVDLILKFLLIPVKQVEFLIYIYKKVKGNHIISTHWKRWHVFINNPLCFFLKKWFIVLDNSFKSQKLFSFGEKLLLNLA